MCCIVSSCCFCFKTIVFQRFSHFFVYPHTHFQTVLYIFQCSHSFAGLAAGAHGREPTARLATYLFVRRPLLRSRRRKSDVKRVFQSRENRSFNLFTTGDLLHTRAGPAEHKQNNDCESRSRRLLPLPRCMRCPNICVRLTQPPV